MGAGVLSGFLAALDGGLERIAEERVGLGMVAFVLADECFDGFVESCGLHQWAVRAAGAAGSGPFSLQCCIPNPSTRMAIAPAMSHCSRFVSSNIAQG